MKLLSLGLIYLVALAVEASAAPVSVIIIPELDANDEI